MKKAIMALALVALLFTWGCATQENQQIILSNQARQKIAMEAEKSYLEALSKAETPEQVVAMSLAHAYQKPTYQQKVETVRGYIGALGDLMLRTLPFIHKGVHKNRDSGNISAGRDVYVNSTKGDITTAQMGINESVTSGDRNSQAESYTTSEEVAFAPEEEAEE